MIWLTVLRRHLQPRAALLPFLIGAAITGCDALDVSDPLVVLDEDLNNPEGARLLRHQALGALSFTLANSAWHSGLISDEFFYQEASFWELFGAVSPEELVDRRDIAEHLERWGGENGSIQNGTYQPWQELLLRYIPAALDKLRAYAPADVRDIHIAELLAIRGFAIVHLAEHFCPGFPLHEVANYKLTFGPAVTTEQAFEKALAAFDSAMILAADSPRILNLARVGRARTLLGLGRFADAAAAVAEVPTDFVYDVEYTESFDTFQPNELGMTDFRWGDERSVADREGDVGLDFVSAGDPRVPVVELGVARNETTILYGIGKYPTMASPIPLASGIEARLIEAEASLQSGAIGAWLGTLNELRATVGLDDVTDPGTTDARVDLMFRERAFWLFGTAHRLGDLRRLIRQYGRASESVFPTGAYWRGGTYSTATSFPFDRSEVTFSPGITGCTGA